MYRVCLADLLCDLVDWAFLCVRCCCGIGGRVWLVCGWARPPLVFSLPVLSKCYHFVFSSNCFKFDQN